ncbi:MAG: preprotein translocase subunit TatC [Phycisphaerales bacterium]|nr:preprotein translocase subunit TatC [Phycisphaerales bacterium]
MFSPKHNPAAHLLAEAVMPFGDHLEELRKRMILALIAIVPLFLVAMGFSSQLLDVVIAPVQRALNDAGLASQLIETAPAETFMTALRLSVVGTILAGSPWIMFQAWLFVAPGLYANERRFVYILLPLSAVLTLSAVVFLYVVLMPLMLSFFIGFGATVSNSPAKTAPVPEGVVFPSVPLLGADPETIEPGMIWYNTDLNELRLVVPGHKGGAPEVLAAPMTRSAGIIQQYRVAEYTKMFLGLAMSFSVGFQTPAVVLLLGWVGIIEPRNLLKYRRHVMMVCLVLGAVLTPADPASMILLAIPLYFLFELGVVLHRLLPAERVSRGFGRKKEPADAGDE